MNFLRLMRSEADKPLGGRYQVVGHLGVGGFGQTFLAEDLHLPGHPRCVLKQLKPQATDPASLQVARRLFDTEAQVLYQLGNHPQIPRLLAHFEENAEFYLAQELIEGVALTEALVEGRPWPEAIVVSVLQDLLQTLAFVHEQKVIHRDIKPSNLIRRQSDGHIVLIDFGAVKQTSTTIAQPSLHPTQTIAIGTQGYMPHEQYAGHPRFSSDIYAVGMLGIQALTGIVPRSLRSDAQTGEVVWHQFAPQISTELRQILDRMVQYDFRERYASAAEALAAFQAMTSGSAAGAADLSLAEKALWPESVQPTPNADLTIAPETDLSGFVEQSELPDETQHYSWGLEPPTAETGATVPVLQSSKGLPRSIPRSIRLKRLSLESLNLKGLSLENLRTNRSIWIAAGAAIAVVGVSFLLIESFILPQPGAVTAQNSPPPSSQPEELSQPTASPQPGQISAAAAAQPAAAQLITLANAALVNQAEALRQGKQYQAAIQLYERAIAANAKAANAHWGRCYSLNQLQQYDPAIAACDRAIALNPKYAEAIWSKGFALEQKQRYTEALSLYDRTLQLKPDFADAWNNRGTALLRLQRLEEAIAAFDKATQLKPKLAEAWSNRSVALWSLQRYDQALASVERALQVQPDYPDAINLRQQMRQKLGR